MATPRGFSTGSAFNVLAHRLVLNLLCHHTVPACFATSAYTLKGRKRRHWFKERRRKVYIAVPAYVGSLAEVKKVSVIKPVQPREQEQNIKLSHSISSMLAQTWLILGHRPGSQWLQSGLTFSQVVWLIGL
eukprot:1150356-Pelagomonas_calceolata.AAC.5